MTSLDVDGYRISIVLMDMVYGIKEEIFKNKDDSYTVFLNSRYNDETLKQAFAHAVEHIKKNDWEKTDVQAIEAESHNISITSEPVSEDEFDILIKRLRKKREAVKKRLKKYEKKYANMSIQDIQMHNDRVIKMYEDMK